MAYNKDAQKKYNEKVKMFALRYTPTDIKDGKRLEKYLKDNNLSCNAYLKSLVKKDLDEKGIDYLPESDTEE